MTSEAGSIAYTKPLPRPRKIDEPYWEAARRNELRVQRCLECGEWWLPPSDFCPNCLAHNFEWAKASGLGTIWTRIFMHQVYYQAFAGDVPYNIVWVRLDEGPMLTANVVGTANASINVGDRVEVTFDRVTDEFTLPRFRVV
jgi:uncharacterized OB-fold protein